MKKKKIFKKSTPLFGTYYKMERWRTKNVWISTYMVYICYLHECTYVYRIYVIDFICKIINIKASNCYYIIVNAIALMMNLILQQKVLEAF